MPRGLIRELRGRIVASEGLCVGPCDNHAPVRPRPVAVPSSVETRAFLCLCAGACGIACAPILVRLSETGPVASAFWRTAVAAPVLCLWARRAAPRPVSASLRPAVAAGLFFAADLAVWHWSDYLYVGRQRDAARETSPPIFVTLASWLFFRKRVTRPFLVGMMSAIAGMFVLVGAQFRGRWDEIDGGRPGRPHRRVLRGIHGWPSRQRAMPGCRPCDSWPGVPALRRSRYSPPRYSRLSRRSRRVPPAGRSWRRSPLVSQVLGQGSHCLRVRASLRVALEREPALAAGPGDALCLGAFQRNNRAFTTDRRGRRARGNLARAAGKLALFWPSAHAPLRAITFPHGTCG